MLRTLSTRTALRAATRSYAVWGAKTAETGKTLEKMEWKGLELKDDWVEVKIDMTGLCHTDVHMTCNDWGVSHHPHVPGHEGVGHVTKVGKLVKGLKVGDRVGIPWVGDSCGECDACKDGRENNCEATYNSVHATVFSTPENNGSYAEIVRLSERLAPKIPDALTSEEAAPLLCAGITMYTPLREYINRPGMRVGIVGMGGLGHLGVKFAARMGAIVTGFSTHEAKRDVVKSWGAARFCVTTDEAQMKAFQLSQDLIINTVSGPIANETEKFVGGFGSGILAHGGAYVITGMPSAGYAYDFNQGIAPIVFGGSKYLKEMLALAAANHIVPDVKVMPMDKCNEAYKEVYEKSPPYRIVLKW